jgi:hypothetical protein
LFIDVPEVEIEIGHRGPPGIALGFDILYDRGTKSMMSVSQRLKKFRKDKPEDTFA